MNQTTKAPGDAGGTAAQLAGLDLLRLHDPVEGVPDSAQPDFRSSESLSVKRQPVKKKKKAGPVVIDLPPAPPETPEEAERWAKELRPGRSVESIPSYGILNASYKTQLSTFLTPSCASLILETPRLLLRQVVSTDLNAIKRIKTEPIVQRTQLYGSPHELIIRDAFLERYIRSSIPRASTEDRPSQCRELYVFAITMKDPQSVEVGNGLKLKLGNRIKDAEGYIGNIALGLSNYPTSNLLPKSRKVFTQPSFDQTASAELVGTLFFEIHPQLWGRGIMGEAFAEVVRFAMEEVGCLELKCDPVKGNEACIKLCQRHGFKYTNTSTDNPYKKQQVWHKITRREWWDKNRPKEMMRGMHDGKILCRWCINPYVDVRYRCTGCDWGIYCSRECQRADWVFDGGHQSECEKKGQ